MDNTRVTFSEPLRLVGVGRPRAAELPDLMLASGVTAATTGQIAGYLDIPKDQVR